jgi:hypothetical protein
MLHVAQAGIARRLGVCAIESLARASVAGFEGLQPLLGLLSKTVETCPGREISGHGNLLSVAPDVRSSRLEEGCLFEETRWVGAFPCRGLEAPHSALRQVSKIAGNDVNREERR